LPVGGATKEGPARARTCIDALQTLIRPELCSDHELSADWMPIADAEENWRSTVGGHTALLFLIRVDKFSDSKRSSPVAGRTNKVTGHEHEVATLSDCICNQSQTLHDQQQTLRGQSQTFNPKKSPIFFAHSLHLLQVLKPPITMPITTGCTACPAASVAAAAAAAEVSVTVLCQPCGAMCVAGLTAQQFVALVCLWLATNLRD